MIDETGASVSAVENPHTDDITKAWAAVDAAQERYDDNADEVDRMKAKLARAQADVAAAKDAVTAAQDARNARKDEIDAAKADVDKAEKANPELAKTVTDRRKQAHGKRRSELEAQLARLTKGN